MKSGTAVALLLLVAVHFLAGVINVFLQTFRFKDELEPVFAPVALHFHIRLQSARQPLRIFAELEVQLLEGFYFFFEGSEVLYVLFPRVFYRFAELPDVCLQRGKDVLHGRAVGVRKIPALLLEDVVGQVRELFAYWIRVSFSARPRCRKVVLFPS